MSSFIECSDIHCNSTELQCWLLCNGINRKNMSLRPYTGPQASEMSHAMGVKWAWSNCVSCVLMLERSLSFCCTHSARFLFPTSGPHRPTGGFLREARAVFRILWVCCHIGVLQGGCSLTMTGYQGVRLQINNRLVCVLTTCRKICLILHWGVSFLQIPLTGVAFSCFKPASFLYKSWLHLGLGQNTMPLFLNVKRQNQAVFLSASFHCCKTVSLAAS